MGQLLPGYLGPVEFKKHAMLAWVIGHLHYQLNNETRSENCGIQAHGQ